MSVAFIANVVSQHAEEAAMLSILRGAAVGAPHYGLADLAKLDGRVEAHLDGLRIAGEEGWKLCEEQLAAKEEGEVFAAGVLACESGKAELMAKVLPVVEAEPKLAGGLISALAWPAFEQVEAHIRKLLQGSNPVHQLIGIGASAVHRRHPGQVLLQAARSPDATLKARALRAAGEFQDRSLERAIMDSLRDADPEVRFAAAWSGTVMDLPSAMPVLREIAESGSSHAGDAASLVARRMDPAAAASWHKGIAGNSKQARLAISIAGAVGDPVFITWLISLMGLLPIARPAGEAFTTITGVDLAYRDLERKPPEDFNAGPTEDPKDENVAMDPDDNLPWPEPALVQKWWDVNRGQFQSGTRHLLGKPLTIEWLSSVLRDGRQRHRAAAALELAIRQTGQPLFNVEAPGFRQIAVLGQPGPVIR